MLLKIRQLKIYITVCIQILLNQINQKTNIKFKYKKVQIQIIITNYKMNYPSQPIQSDRTSSNPIDERQTRQSLQQIYKQKLKQIQSFYSEQNKSLRKTLEESYKKVLSDELLLTMIGDRTTSKYIQQRIEQCFQQIVFNEREIIIQNQNVQITQLKFHSQQLNRRYQKLKIQFQQQNQLSYRQKLSNQTKKNQLNEQLKRKTQQTFNLNLKIKTLQSHLNEKSLEVKQLFGENIQLKKVLENIDTEMETAIEMNNDKYSRQNGDISKYRENVEDLEKKLKQKEEYLASMETQYKRSITQYRNKLQQYKQKMTLLMNQKGNTKLAQQGRAKSSNKSAVINPSNQTQLQKKLTHLVQQNQKRFNELKQQKQKQRNQLERKYQSRQRQTQQYYQKILQKKILEVNGQASQFWQNIKIQQVKLRGMLKNYQDNYVSNEEHYTVLKEREELIMKMKEKMEEYEESIDQNVEKINEQEREINRLQGGLTERNNQAKKLQTAFNNQVTITKQLQQSIAQLKSQLKKSQTKISTLQQQISSVALLLQQQRSAKTKFSQDLYSLDKQLKQKQKKYKQLYEQFDEKQRKCKKYQNQLTIVNNNYNEIQQLFKQNKRVLSELEFKIKQMEHENYLTAGEYNHKIKKLTQEVGNKNEQIRGLEGHYKTIQEEFLVLKSTHTEVETINKKLQLQTKYLKQTQNTIKNDSIQQINDLKQRVQQKSNQILALKNEIISREQSFSIKFKENNQYKRAQQSQLKAYLQSINRLQKLFRTKVTDLNKQIDAIRSCVNNCRVIFQNQLILGKKTLSIQLLQLQRNHVHEINQRILSQRAKFQSQRKNIGQSTTQQKKSLQKQLSLSLQKQKQSFYEIIQTKDKQQNKLETQLKMLTYELQKHKQEQIIYEKKIQSYENKLQKQEDEHNRKMKELYTEYENEKNMLVEENEQKRDITNGQIQELTRTLQKVKIQLENIKSQYDDEKLQLNSQLRSVQQQENIVKQAVYRKQQQIKRLDQQLQRITEQRNYYQNNLRQLSAQDQRKIVRIHELEFIHNDIQQNMNLLKVKLERTEEQNSLLKQSFKQNEDSMNREIKNRIRVENQLKDIKAAIDRNDKFRDLRALQQMTVQTQELTNKVNQMKKMAQYLDRTPLRS